MEGTLLKKETTQLKNIDTLYSNPLIPNSTIEEPVGYELPTMWQGYHPADFNVGKDNLRETTKINDDDLELINKLGLHIGSNYLLRNDQPGTKRVDYIATLISSFDNNYLIFYTLYYRYRRFSNDESYDTWKTFDKSENIFSNSYSRLKKTSKEDLLTKDLISNIVKEELYSGKSQFTTKTKSINENNIFK